MQTVILSHQVILIKSSDKKASLKKQAPPVELGHAVKLGYAKKMKTSNNPTSTVKQTSPVKSTSPIKRRPTPYSNQKNDDVSNFTLQGLGFQLPKISGNSQLQRQVTASRNVAASSFVEAAIACASHGRCYSTDEQERGQVSSP